MRIARRYARQTTMIRRPGESEITLRVARARSRARAFTRHGDKLRSLAQYRIKIFR